MASNVWDAYFKRHSTRKPLPFFLKALEIAETSTEKYLAVDLGAGAGVECVELLRRGWRTHAIDGQDSALKMLQDRVPQEAQGLITYQQSFFEDLKQIPINSFFYSYHSIPFCKKNSFQQLWRVITDSIKSHGILAVSLFGFEDDWVIAGMTTGVSKDQLEVLLKDFDIIESTERNESGGTVRGEQKNWHTYEIIARKKEVTV